MICICCKSKDIVKEKNDDGHIKLPGHQPKRIYRYACLKCGHIMHKIDVDGNS